MTCESLKWEASSGGMHKGRDREVGELIQWCLESSLACFWQVVKLPCLNSSPGPKSAMGAC